MARKDSASVAGWLYARMKAWWRDDMRSELWGLLPRIDRNGRPQTNPLAQALKDNANLRWNMKVLAAALAEQAYATGRAGPQAAIPADPQRVGLRSKLCCQADIEAAWARHWCGQLQIAPLYRRGVWELCFVLQAVWEAGLLAAGKTGLGFAVGKEALPAYIASRGVAVLATDMGGVVDPSRLWRGVEGHAARIGDLARPPHLEGVPFWKTGAFRAMDMTTVPEDLETSFDFCWSVCAFGHLGSVEAGLVFVENSLKALKPGGIAVHTSEYNLDGSDESTDNWPTVLFTKQHLDDLAGRLAAKGHELVAVDLDAGSGLFDRFIDHPPYEHDPHPALGFPAAPHLKLSVDGFPMTSIGLIIRKAA